jgi:endonuclease/exonuclease/phosphatase (EEP) superfamily protein YafD
VENVGFVHRTCPLTPAVVRGCQTGRVHKPRRPHPIALVLSTFATLAGLAAGVLYLFPQLQATKRALALASAFLPYAVIAWLVAVVVMLLGTIGRRHWPVLPLVAGLLASSLMFVPYVSNSSGAPAGTAPTLRLMSLNMYYGQADLKQLLAEVKRVDPDILVLTEFTSTADPVLDSAEWKRLLPYHVGTTGRESGPQGDWGDASGTQVLSRMPLTELASTGDTRATSLAVEATAGGHSFVLVAAHPANMLSSGVDGWLRESQEVIGLTQRYTSGPVVLAGDLNSVPEHLTTRNLLAATGLHEALTGWQPTYPANRLVPLIRIDHVLASKDFATVSTSTFDVTGSDHRGVIAELAQS